MVTPDVIKMVADQEIISKHYLMYYFNSATARNLAQQLAFGTTRLRLTLPIFRQIPVPLPPLDEQIYIVQEAERLLSEADNLEALIQTNLKRAERLRQSILKKAFSGELVSQDPTDEPASVLLERIKAQRSAAPTKGRKRS